MEAIRGTDSTRAVYLTALCRVFGSARQVNMTLAQVREARCRRNALAAHRYLRQPRPRSTISALIYPGVIALAAERGPPMPV